MCRCLLLLILGVVPPATAAPPLAAQSVLPSNTAVVVTTDGLWIPDTASSTPLLHLPPSAFPGAGDALLRPAVEWHRPSDTLLVTSGARLYRVSIASLAPPDAGVEDVTPASAVPLDLWDLDVHPGSGALWLLEQMNNEALRFAPPFAAGMQPELALPVPATSRALAIDSRALPPALVVTTTNGAVRVTFDGAQQLATALLGGRGVDVNPQFAGALGTFLVAPATNEVVRATSSPNLALDMNFFGFCVPLALSPQDVEWNALQTRAWVLAGEGINTSIPCQQQLPAVGANHVIRFPVAQAPPVVVPKLVTHPGGSGITGAQGDLTLVLDEFAFVAPYGAGCAGASAGAPQVDVGGVPYVDAPFVDLELQGGAAHAPVWLFAGLAPSAGLLVDGCELLVTPQLVRLVGSTDGGGEFFLRLRPPPGVLPGDEAFVQLAVRDGAGLATTQGLQVRFGE